MTAARLDLVIEQNATFSRTFTLSNASTGLPVNLTGATISLQGWEPDGTLVFDLTTGNGKIVFIDALLGTFTATESATNTAAITAPYLATRLNIVYPGGSGRTDRVFHGKATISFERSI